MSKIACQLSADAVRRVLAPLQFGVGIKAGTEIVVHSCREFVEHSLVPGNGNALVKLDFANAFNSVLRPAMELEVRKFPELYSMFALEYAVPSILQFRDRDMTAPFFAWAVLVEYCPMKLELQG